jgi:hypothetical protein
VRAPLRYQFPERLLLNVWVLVEIDGITLPGLTGSGDADVDCGPLQT